MGTSTRVQAANETSGLTTRAIVRYIRSVGGEAAVERVLERSGVKATLAHLEDESSWSSYDDKIALFEAAGQVLDDPLVARHVGETVLRLRVAFGLVVLLRAVGSPELVLRNISATAAKFSTCCTMQTLDASATGARVTYRLHDGFEPSRHDCNYNVGLLSQVSEVFGLPPATVTHPYCQVAGAEECVYDLRWPRHSRLPWVRRRSRGAYLADQVKRLREHSDDLRTTIADLVSTDEVDTLLQKIATRASAAVNAPQHLLVVRVGHSTRIHQRGLPDDAARDLAERLLRDDLMPSETATHLVAPVASARNDHGRLAAIFPGQATFFPEERQLLESYAQQAAAALDSAIALEEARSRGETASSLLELARSLTSASSAQEVAEVVAASIPRVLGAGSGWFGLTDAATGDLVVVAAHGVEQEREDDALPYRITRSVSPTVTSLLEAGAPAILARDAADPFIQAALDRFGAQATLAAPVLVEGSVGGFIFAVLERLPGESESRRLLDRLAGVADQSALALERAQLVERLRQQADQDVLTGLPNARLFERYAEQAFKLARRNRKRVALMFVDLDNFKRVNDTLGHSVGDELLRQVADRLRAEVRSSDVVARMGGDEFLVMLHSVAGADDATRVAAKLLASLAQPVVVEGRELVVSSSIGVALFPDHGKTPEDVLRAADSAMYRAKARGRNAYQLFAAELARSESVLDLEAQLREAIRAEMLRLDYQPIFGVESGALVGCEALVRWRHPELGEVPASQIVDVAEQSGLILDLGRWVLQASCRQLQAWRRQGLDLQLHVNVSASEFRQPHLLDSVSEALAACQLDPHKLVLEVTESAAVRDPAEAAELSVALHQLGVRLALDDFGTGYSMLGRLQHLRFDQLKIERTFISDIGGDEGALQIITALIALGHALRLEVVAEGIETPDQLEFLRAQGCEYAQGTLLGKPQPAADLAALAAPTARR